MSQAKSVLNRIHQSYENQAEAFNHFASDPQQNPTCSIHSFSGFDEDRNNSLSMYFYPDGSAIIANAAGMQTID